MQATGSTWRLGIGLLLLGAGCATAPRGGANTWPYPAITSVQRPPGLPGESLFMGGWITPDGEGRRVMVETTDPRYLALFDFDDPYRRSFFDLGVGAEVENLAFIEREQSVLLVGAVASSEPGRAATYARSLLEVDLEQRLLVDTIPLPRDGTCRGVAVDSRSRRVFLLDDDGAGHGRVDAVDMYGGARTAARRIGSIPRAVERKGLALNRDARYVYCLSGGESARSDFEPVTPEEPETPGVVILGADSLEVLARVTLGERFEPVGLGYEASRDLVVVLETNLERSRVVTVDGTFFEIRNQVVLPEPATDLAVAGGYAFCPARNGLYAVDLEFMTLAGRADVILGFSGEIAVSGDLETAYVLFHSTEQGGTPGLARIALRSGQLVGIVR